MKPYVKKVVLFGSLTEETRFNERSDMDIAVEGLPKYEFFKALGHLMMESPWPVDLIPAEAAGNPIRQRIEKGIILYEDRKTT